MPLAVSAGVSPIPRMDEAMSITPDFPSLGPGRVSVYLGHLDVMREEAELALEGIYRRNATRLSELLEDGANSRVAAIREIKEAQDTLLGIEVRIMLLSCIAVGHCRKLGLLVGHSAAKQRSV